MKIISLIAILITVSWSLYGQDSEVNTVFKDTVIIEFGNNSKMVIHLKDKEDLDELLEYDINAMLEDLSLTIDSADAETTYLMLEDASGERYLSDTTIVVRSEGHESEDHDSKDHEEEINIKIGNVKFSGKIKDWEEYEEEFEDWEDGPDFKTSTYVKEHKGNVTSFDIDLGMNNFFENGKFPDGGAPYSVKPWGSWYIAFGPTVKSSGGGVFFLEWGANVGWYSFKFDNPQVRLEKTDDQLEFNFAPAEIAGQKSKLTASFLNISLVPMLDFAYGKRKVKKRESGSFSIETSRKQGFRMGFGGYTGYRLGSHTKYKFKENGDTEKDKDSGNFFLNNWRYGLRARVGWKDLDVFFNYDLNSLFSEDNGPDLNAFSFGIVL